MSSFNSMDSIHSFFSEIVVIQILCQVYLMYLMHFHTYFYPLRFFCRFKICWTFFFVAPFVCFVDNKSMHICHFCHFDCWLRLILDNETDLNHFFALFNPLFDAVFIVEQLQQMVFELVAIMRTWDIQNLWEFNFSTKNMWNNEKTQIHSARVLHAVHLLDVIEKEMSFWTALDHSNTIIQLNPIQSNSIQTISIHCIQQ